MQVYTVSDAARRFGLRREDILAVAEEEEIGRQIGTTFVFTREELDDLEDALVEEGLLTADGEDGPDEDDEGVEDSADDGGDE